MDLFVTTVITELFCINSNVVIGELMEDTTYGL